MLGSAPANPKMFSTGPPELLVIEMEVTCLDWLPAANVRLAAYSRGLVARPSTPPLPRLIRPRPPRTKLPLLNQSGAVRLENVSLVASEKFTWAVNVLFPLPEVTRRLSVEYDFVWSVGVIVPFVASPPDVLSNRALVPLYGRRLKFWAGLLTAVKVRLDGSPPPAAIRPTS